jgi:DNA-binding HxlR family transcriptional regulator
MKRTSFKKMNCSIARTLEVVGEWWSLLVLRDVLNGVRRFDELQESLGVARNILASRLAKLVAEGVLERVRYQERPPRFEYRPSEKGRDLQPVLLALLRWGDKWASGAKGPPIVLVDRETGEPIEPVLYDARTGRPLDPKRMRIRPGGGANAQQRRRFGAR